MRLRDVGVHERDFSALAEAVLEEVPTMENPRPISGVADVIELLERLVSPVAHLHASAPRTINTTGPSPNPPPRGAFWGDFASWERVKGQDQGRVCNYL